MVNNNKPVLLKTSVAGKSPTELLELIPGMVCREITIDYGNGLDISIERDDYTILGFGKGTILLGYTCEYDTDDFGWPEKIDAVLEVELDELEADPTIKYIYTTPATKKQIDFLESRDYDCECLSKYRAWYMVEDCIEADKHARRKRKSWYVY